MWPPSTRATRVSPTRGIDDKDAAHRRILDARADGRAPPDGRRRGLALPRALQGERGPTHLPQGQSRVELASRGWGLRGTPPAPPSSLRLTEDRHRAGRGLFSSERSRPSTRACRPLLPSTPGRCPSAGALGGRQEISVQQARPEEPGNATRLKKSPGLRRPTDVGRHTTIQKHMEFFTPLTAL